MKYFGIISLLCAVAVIGFWFSNVEKVDTMTETETTTVTLDPAIQAHIEAKSGLITVNEPQPNATVADTINISGQARGYWFFEGSFPVVLTDWDGRIIAEHYATAEGDWMSEEFVPFTSTLELDSPYHQGDADFMRRGTLILQRANPSGLPENADALEFPVYFGDPAEENAALQYQDAIESAESAAEVLAN